MQMKKKRGRPPIKHTLAAPLTIRLPQEMMNEIDRILKWRPDHPTKGQLIRELLSLGMQDLAFDGVGGMRTDGVNRRRATGPDTQNSQDIHDIFSEAQNQSGEAEVGQESNIASSGGRVDTFGKSDES